jgi:primosomal protein N' (replication factor Y)
MPSFVEVSVNVPQIRGAFHYHLPTELEGMVQPGHLVEVPFGHQMVQGVVIRFVETPSVPKTKPIVCLIDNEVVLTHTQIRLAEELAEITLSPLSACIDVMIPSGLGQMADSLYTFSGRHRAGGGQPLTTQQNRLLGLIDQRGPLRARQIDRLLPHIDWRLTANSLVRLGLLERSSVLPQPTVKPKHVRTVQLAIAPEKALPILAELGRAGSQALQRRQSIVRFLLHEPGPIDVAWVYAESGGTLADIKYLAERGILHLGESEIWRDRYQVRIYSTGTPRLTHDQQAAWVRFERYPRCSDGRTTRPYLLHG